MTAAIENQALTADGTAGAEERPRRARKQRLPQWADAIPADLDITDDLEVIATLGFRSLAVALARVCADPFLKLSARVALISQINSQLQGAKSMRRIWLAEQVIKGNERAIAETAKGRALEMRDHVTSESVAQQTSRPTARRGRPRKH